MPKTLPVKHCVVDTAPRQDFRSATPQKPAVLIIDVQGLLCAGRFQVHDAAGVVARINRLSARAREFHFPVAIVQHEDFDAMTFESPGWQLAAGLECDATDWRIRKTRSDAFAGTGLEQRLRDAGVTDLIICGMQTDFCVESSVRRALGLGFPVMLVSDGHSTVANAVLSAEQIIAHHTLTLASIGSYGVRVEPLSTDESLERMSRLDAGVHSNEAKVGADGTAI